MVDLRPQLLGRGTYGPERLPRVRGPRHLWNHVSMPPAQNSLIIYKDGTVLEGNNFAPWQYDPVIDSNVHRFIYGGTNVRCGDLDQFSHDTLIANGYTCGVPHTMDVYVPSDKYTDQYPLVAGTTSGDAVTAGLAARAARIAELEAELAALKGTP